MTLKERIQELCKKQNISMNQLETELGFGKGYLSKLNRSTPNAIKIQRIAEKLGVSVDYLMNGTKTEVGQGLNLGNETTENVQEIFENPDIRRIARARNKMPQKDKEKMMELLKLSFEEYFRDDYVDNDDD